MRPAVLLPARVVFFGADRLFPPLADEGVAMGPDPKTHQIGFGGGSASLAQRQVVFSRAARVAMSLKWDARGRPSLQEIRIPLKHGASVIPYLCFVVIEIRIGQRFFCIELVQRLLTEDLLFGQRSR